MRRTRILAGVTGTALTASLTWISGGLPASAEPTTPGAAVEGAQPGRGPATATRVEPLQQAPVAEPAPRAPAADDVISMPTSYPYQPELRTYRDAADDAAHTAGLLGHADLAPRLIELMDQSDRVSVQVVGQSTEGRDLYLVTLTQPESPATTAQQTAWRELIKNDPEAAAADTELRGQYKTPVWFSNNIHGNEWEGTDAAMRYIEYLATAPAAEVSSILRNNRLYFSVALNPDGRTNATRATAIGLDPNRDIITNTTPETQSYIRSAQAIQPVYTADFHGYTRVLQVEPTGPPHGSNYEYDLYLPHNYALARKVEDDVVAAAIPGNTYLNVVTGQVVTENTSPDTAHIKIPYRDTPSGWDDFPPIFTAQYAAFYGAASSTVELPLQRNLIVNGTSRISPDRAAINTAVAYQTVESMVEYMNDVSNAREMLANQIETFRRGAAGEPKTQLTTENIADVPGPDEWKPLWDVADDQEPVTLPRAYVIPVGDEQRSASDAARLVRQLLTHNIEVGTLDEAVTVDGTAYPAGSYVVDMHQPLRGLANSLLDLGEDISDKVPSMYDISGWSYAYTWGATVDKVGLTTDPALGSVTPIGAPASNAAVPGQPDYLSFELAGVADYQALNAVLDEDVTVSMLESGVAVLGPEAYDEAVAASGEFDIAFERASDEELDALDDDGTRGLSDLVLGYVGTQDDRLSLTELGFDELRQLTVTGLNANPALLDGVDLLWVGSSFNPAADSAARTAVQSFVDAGGSIVGRTSQAFAAAQSFGLLSGTVVSGSGSGNGIVDVDTPEGSLFEAHAQDTSFIYPAFWFTGLGENVTVEERYAEGNPLLAGHWRPSGAGINGPANAAGNASVVSAETVAGSRTVVFGTSVFFRTHPKGGMSQAARAIFWAAPEGEDVLAPQGTSVTIAPVAKVAYPGDATVEAVVQAGDGSVDGTIELVSGEDVVATAETTAGAATLVVPGLEPGTTTVVAEFTPHDASYEPSVSDPADIVVTRARSTTEVTATQVGTGERGAGIVEVTIDLSIPGLSPTGEVTLRESGEVLRTVRLTETDEGRKVVTMRLARGKHTLRATFEATDLVRSSSDRVTFRVR